MSGNAVAERFFLHLKMACVRHHPYANHAKARKDMIDHIVGFNICTRLRSVLSKMSPVTFERNIATKKPIRASEFTWPHPNNG